MHCFSISVPEGGEGRRSCGCELEAQPSGPEMEAEEGVREIVPLLWELDVLLTAATATAETVEKGGSTNNEGGSEDCSSGA